MWPQTVSIKTLIELKKKLLQIKSLDFIHSAIIMFCMYYTLLNSHENRLNNFIWIFECH